MKRNVALPMLICVVLSVLVFSFTKGRGYSPQNASNIRSESLRERAKRTGGITGTAHSTNLRRYDDLSQLAKESDIILTGFVESENSQLLPPKERLVVTDSNVKVQELLKGSVEPSQTIVVRGPGGRVDFGDGTFADL